jgi:RHS repeat-associated protein
VFFDNLSIKHYAGPLTEETHYYPFGLTMAGISSKAAGKSENRRKFNDGTELESKEFSDGSGLELYGTDFRSYDPQIGRFHQKDPLGEWTESWSLYSFAYNNPILFNDPLGLSSDTTTLPEVVIHGGPPPPPKCLHCNVSLVVPGSNPVSPSQGSSGRTNPAIPSNELPPGEDITKWEDWVYQLNSFNPFANGVNSLYIYFTGKDSYGVPQDNYAAAALAIGIIPVERVASAPAIAIESIWTATKDMSAVKNAFKHWKAHGKEFPELFNSKQYAEAARKFLHNSPEGTLIKVRPNGDVLKYHPETNTFGVMDANGAPRTMFKPADGMEYWLKQ